jgi:hypothetical protein
MAFFLKPLPYLQPDELIDLNHTAPGVNFPDADPAPFLYFTYREQGRSFQSIGLYRGSPAPSPDSPSRKKRSAST